jgi:RNA polymerase sigma-70 factor, ECF subfamily
MMPRFAVSPQEFRVDAELVARLRRGEPAALTALYGGLGPELTSLAARLSGSLSDAEDVLHDLIVGLPESLRSYEERGRFRHWVRQVVVRMVLMRLRSARRRREAPIDAAANIATRPLEHDGVNDAVEGGIRALPPSLRTVVVLRLVEGMSHQEIADALGISVSASETRLSRGLTALRATLQHLI